jgi:hypothetical protein
MSQRPLRRTFASFLFAALFLTTLLLSAAPAQAMPREGRGESGFTVHSETRSFSVLGFLQSLLEKAGVRIDDNGIW